MTSKLKGKCCCTDKLTSPLIKCNDLDLAHCLELQKIIEAIAAPGKGLVACDESPESLDERFQQLGIENTEITRRDYREMLLSANKDQLSQYISGVILHHETIYQKTSRDVEFIEFLRQYKIVAGVKVDRGLVPLFGTDNEMMTQGLDDLQQNCIQFKKEGCHFARWRCVFSITDRCPSQLAMIANANILARYASICQSARIVPIVESELSGDEHDIDRALEVQEQLLSILFRSLNEHHVYLEGMILKPTMVLPGKNDVQCAPEIIAEYTITALQRTVPIAVPAIFFLSGDQSDEEAMINLHAINIYDAKKPWTLTFCYGRVLQDAALEAWQGYSENVAMAQDIFLKKCKLCSNAALGQLKLNDLELNMTENKNSMVKNVEMV